MLPLGDIAFHILGQGERCRNVVRPVKDNPWMLSDDLEAAGPANFSKTLGDGVV